MRDGQLPSLFDFRKKERVDMKRLISLVLCLTLFAGLSGYAAGEEQESLPVIREGLITRELAGIGAKDGIEPFAEYWTGGEITADLSDAPGLAWSLIFSSATKFSKTEKLPKGYDPQALMEWGKEPGLNVDILHEHGFTGKGMTVAYVDQPFSDHEQIQGANIHYTNNADQDHSMHGSTVVSMLLGKDIGTAPEVELYYYGHASWKGDLATRAECLYQLIEQNRQLPEGQKIRMVGFSDNLRPGEEHNDLFEEAVRACEQEGIMVWFCGDYAVAAFLPMSDRNNPDNLAPDSRYGGGDPPLVYVPGSGVTAATDTGKEDYIYWAQGGLSWTMPYMLGLYAIVLEIDPAMTQEEIRQMVRETAFENIQGFRFVDPLAFVCVALRRVGRDGEAEAMEAEARARRRYLYAVMDTAQMTAEDLEAVGAWLGSVTESTPVIVDAAAFSDAQGLYSAMREDAAKRGGVTDGVQIFGTPAQVPSFEIQYKADMAEYGIDEAGPLLTDLFYGHFRNEPDSLTADWNVMDDVADGTLDLQLMPEWPVARLPLQPGEYKAFFEKYNAFVLSTGLERLDIVNFSNPIFAQKDHIDDFGTFLLRADKEFKIMDVPYRLYGNLKGQYPVRNKVLGGFEAENMAKENQKGPVEFIINTHGQRDNIDCTIFENDEEKRISLVNMGNIDEVLGANPYYLDGWCCLNGTGMADNLVTAALSGRCVGMYGATHIISNNGVQVKASLKQMADSNFYYFYYHYLKALHEGKVRSRAFFTAQREYGLALEPVATEKIDMRKGNPQFNLYNLLVYHNFGVMEPNAAAAAMYDSRCLINQSADSVPKKVSGAIGGNDGNVAGGAGSLRVTDGTSTGNRREMEPGNIMEMLKSGSVKVSGIAAEELDNGYTRFTVSLNAREGLNICVFNPPDGDRIKLFGGPTSGGEEELVFDMAPEELEGLDIIIINLFAADDDRCFIEIRT